MSDKHKRKPPTKAEIKKALHELGVYDDEEVRKALRDALDEGAEIK